MNNITYNNQPNIIEVVQLIFSHHFARGESVYTDLTELFTQAINEGRETITISFISDTGAGRNFSNTRYANEDHHPRLTIITGSLLSQEPTRSLNSDTVTIKIRT